jgi:hypothetical protein
MGDIQGAPPCSYESFFNLDHVQLNIVASQERRYQLRGRIGAILADAENTVPRAWHGGPRILANAASMSNVAESAVTGLSHSPIPSPQRATRRL